MVWVKYREDELLFAKWFRDVVREHMVKIPYHVMMHTTALSKYEVDVVVDDGKKTIAIELKESDYAKAIEQAIARTENFDYVYVAINISARSIMSILRSYKIALEHGVGFVSTLDNCIVIKAYSKRYKNEAKRYINLLDLLEGD